MSDRTKVLSVHRLRRAAREHERRLQDAFAEMEHSGIRVTYGEVLVLPGIPAPSNRVPAWACGVRVEKAGRFSWAVVATEHAGH
jgi:hypothetical protein